MPLSLSYCTKWALAKKKPWKIIDEETARECHHKRQPYSAIISKGENAIYIIDIANEWVSIIFLDDMLRQYLRYDFKEVEPGRLFLRGGYFWEYEGDTDNEMGRKIFRFEENGYSLLAEDNFLTNESREVEVNGGVESNWEKYPEFGEYMYLCRKERDGKV
ncbi:hypothetical protein [Cohnella caldifontis]|uniref:hypothetical protein n=1 Tax=Cohnella caldifontis TaxID=3027471 RepID=UPI0023ECE8E4|nr:hypothetical protein [Cohnella sp. YIM B05605]